MTRNFLELPAQISELTTLNNWVVWKFVENPDGDKSRKVPFTPTIGKGASASDSTTWASYETARKALESGKYEGFGFEFGTKESPSGYAGIDLDNAINDDGTLKPFASDIVQIMNSYTEYSPSRKGLHIILQIE